MFAMIAISLVYANHNCIVWTTTKTLPKSHIQCIIHSYLGRQATPMCCAMDIQLCQPTVCSSVLCKVPTFICVRPLLWWWWTALCLGCELQEILGTHLLTAIGTHCTKCCLAIAREHFKKYWEHTCHLPPNQSFLNVSIEIIFKSHPNHLYHAWCFFKTINHRKCSFSIFPHPSASAGLEVGGGLQEFHLWHPEKIYGIQNRFNLRILPCYTCHAAKNCILRKQEIIPDILFVEIKFFSVVELKISELFTSGQYFSQIVRFWVLKILIRMQLCTMYM